MTDSMSNLANLYFKPNPSKPTMRMTVQDLRLVSQIPSDCLFYVFYIPAIKEQNAELPKTLSDWGDSAGKNVFVGLIKPDAPDFKNFVKTFRVSKTPAVVVCAQPTLSADLEPGKASTAYARIDDEAIMGDSSKILESVQTNE